MKAHFLKLGRGPFAIIGAAIIVTTAHALIDVDSDGMSDIWEQEHGFAISGTPPSDQLPEADPDGDGWTNLEESQAGTDPTSGVSPLGIIQPTILKHPDFSTVFTISWPSLEGKQYTLFASPDLSVGSWIQVDVPVMGTGATIEYGTEALDEDGYLPDRLFWRISVADVDSDGDGLSDYDEGLIGTDPGNSDSDGDGISDGGEVGAGTNPANPAAAPPVDWFVLTGNDAEGVVKTDKRTYTIKKGECRVVIVGTTSEEYPDWTGDESEFNDILTWEIIPSAGDAVSGNINVNQRHDDWDIDWVAGTELNGFKPVHIEVAKVFQAPPEADMTVNVELTATNISDGLLPSTVIVGLVPVEIQRDEEGGTVDWQPIKGQMAKALPGQKINLKPDFSRLPDSITVSNKSWVINGETFADYTASNATAQATPLVSTDYQSEEIHFYWANSGDRAVHVDCFINGVSERISSKINVIKPISSLTATAGAVALIGNTIQQTNGIDFQGQVDSISSDFGTEGEWQYTQLLVNRDYAKYAAPAEYISNNYGNEVLDSTFPYYPNDGTFFATGTAHDESDNPTLHLTGNAIEMGVDSNFKMYIMFRPPGINAKWVPLRVLNWDLEGQATRSWSTWSAVAGSLGGTAEPTGAETHEHPEWTANFDPFSWVLKP